MLCYTELCYDLQKVVPDLGFLAKPHQPNGNVDQVALVDTLGGYESDTLTTHGHP